MGNTCACFPGAGTAGGMDDGATFQHQVSEYVEAQSVVPPHQRLGITLRGLNDYFARIGFPREYTDVIGEDRSRSLQELGTDLTWITKAHGPILVPYRHESRIPTAPRCFCHFPGDQPVCNSYDACEFVRWRCKQDGNHEKSICEILQEEGSDQVDQAQVFVSHIQSKALNSMYSSPIDGQEVAWDVACEIRSIGQESLCTALRLCQNDHAFLWLDVPCLRQCKSDFSPSVVVELVRNIGRVFMEVPQDPHSYLNRTFCVLEAYASVQGRATIATHQCGVAYHATNSDRLYAEQLRGQVVKKVENLVVDVKLAQTRKIEDKQRIDAYVDTLGAEVVNLAVRSALLEGAKQQDLDFAKSFEEAERAILD